MESVSGYRGPEEELEKAGGNVCSQPQWKALLCSEPLVLASLP